MTVQVTPQPTPNPAAFKFTVSGKRFDRPVTISDKAAAQGTFAAPLFELAGVRSVFATADFVTVTKAPEAAWESLVPAVKDALERTL